MNTAFIVYGANADDSYRNMAIKVFIGKDADFRAASLASELKNGMEYDYVHVEQVEVG